MKRFLFERPLSVVAIILAFQTFLYGFGFWFETFNFQQTVLFREMAEVNLTKEFGAGLFLLGLAMTYGILAVKNKVVEYTYQIDAVVWLFAFLIYCLAGAPVLGLAIAGTFSLLSGYVGFAFRNYHK